MRPIKAIICACALALTPSAKAESSTAGEDGLQGIVEKVNV